MEISEKIKYVRQSLNLNQKKFAITLHVTQATVSRYELNKHPPEYTFLYKMVTLLNVNPEWLFNDTSECFLEEDNLDFSAANTAILKDLQLMFTQDQLYSELKEIVILNTIKKFEIVKEEKSLIHKLFTAIKFEGHLPVRPFLFLYYIFQFIIQDYKNKTIINYKEYLIDIIFSYKTLSWNNNPVFSRKMKNEISAKFDNHITEKECQILVDNAKLTLNKLEETIPISMIQYHKKIDLRSLFPNKFN